MPESIEAKLQQIKTQTAAKEAAGRQKRELEDKLRRYESSSAKREPLIRERASLQEIASSLQAGYAGADSSLNEYKQAKGNLRRIMKDYGKELKDLGIEKLGDLLHSEQFNKGDEATAFGKAKGKFRESAKQVKEAKKKAKNILTREDVNKKEAANQGAGEEIQTAVEEREAVLDEGSQSSKEVKADQRREIIDKLEARVAELDSQISGIDKDREALEKELTAMCRSELKLGDLKFFIPGEPKDLEGIRSIANETILPAQAVGEYGEDITGLAVRETYSEYLDKLVSQPAKPQSRWGARQEKVRQENWPEGSKEMGLAIFDFKLAREKAANFANKFKLGEIQEKKKDMWSAARVLQAIAHYRSLDQKMRIRVYPAGRSYGNARNEAAIHKPGQVRTGHLKNLTKQLDEAEDWRTGLLKQQADKEKTRPKYFGKQRFEDEMRGLQDKIYEAQRRKDQLKEQVKAEENLAQYPPEVDWPELATSVFFFDKVRSKFEGWYDLGDFLNQVEAFCRERSTLAPEEEQRLQEYERLQQEAQSRRPKAMN